MASTFLSLPREIRDQIYDYTCDWNNATIRIENIKDRLWEHNTRSTPNVLLLNRQITSEAVQRLRRKPLFYSPRSMISAPATYRLRPFDQVCLPMRLFGSATWQCVPLFVLKDTFFDHGHQHMSSFFYLVSSFHEASRSGWIHPAEFQMHFDIRLHRREDFDLNEYCNGRRVVYDLRKDKDGNHTTAVSNVGAFAAIPFFDYADDDEELG
ncbi:MAG: hypothetical protein M1820_010294 [Bogoriella megaspora]|nr:MAG: hypothetical protein M1820_010294 [Bogoriella megaspora]